MPLGTHPTRPETSVTRLRPSAALLALACTVTLVTACTPNDPDGDPGAASTAPVIGVTSTDDACDLSAATAPAGAVRFSVTNAGSDVTEMYVLAEDGVAVESEVENVGPGLTRDLVVMLDPGTYVVACKPGMVGEGIRTTFTVTGEADGSPDNPDPALTEAAASYLDYVRDEVATLVTSTRAFAALYTAGDDDGARAAYAPTRVSWERIEPVAESFGDLDPRLDLREADLAESEEWTGWHRIEKDLWPPADASHAAAEPAERAAWADLLVADTEELARRVSAADFELTAAQVGNGAKELLDEVATGKVTGEEEIWSHTDLWDFAANVEGARAAYTVLRDAAQVNDPGLVTTLDARFDDLESVLGEHGSIESGRFVLYTELTAEQVRALADAVNAVGEPLSHLTAAVVL